MRKLICSAIFCVLECAALPAFAASHYDGSYERISPVEPISIEANGKDASATWSLDALPGENHGGVVCQRSNSLDCDLADLDDESSAIAEAQARADAANGQVGKGIFDASKFEGNDCGAKINAADAALGKSRGEIDVDPSCGTNWTTQVVLSANHNLKVTQAETFVMQGITVAGNNVIDLGGSTFQIAPYTGSMNAGLFTTYVGKTAAHHVTIENGVLDGNAANTKAADPCWLANCRSAVRLDNNNNGVTAVHDITIEHITFQNWNSAPVLFVGMKSYPLPYNVSILNNKFLDSGGNVIVSSGFDRNIVIRNNYFKSWGTGLKKNHAEPIQTLDYTNYPGTSQFELDISNNIFDNTTIPPDGFGFVAEISAGGAGWITGFTFTGNHMNDNGTNYGGELSGDFVNATVTGNVWTTQGLGEMIGTYMTIGQNSIINGSITIGAPNYFSSQNNSVIGNVVSIPGQIGVPGTGVNQKAIYMAGFPTITNPLTRAIRQTAQEFKKSGGTLTGVTFKPRVSAEPPVIVVTGAFSGGASNGFQNWAFTLAGAKNGGNNGTFICAESTATTLTFVNPFGVSEDLPAGATVTSAASTTAYVGKLSNGSFNGLTGLNNIAVSGFTNAGNNKTDLTVIANSLTVLATTNPTGEDETHAGTFDATPTLNNTVIASNSISMFNSSGACAGIELGSGDGGEKGPVYNISLLNNVITANPGHPCGGITLGTSNTIPVSSGVEILDNNISGVGFGIWGIAKATNFTDVTVAGNKFSNVRNPIYFPTPPPILRQWNNTTSATQSTENLMGGVTIDAGGNALFPGKVFAKSYAPSVVYSASGTPLPSCKSENKGQQAVVGDASKPTYMGEYKGGGSVTAVVICSANGSSYSWVTH